MKPIFVYPGCFAPPTIGHFRLAVRASEVCPELTIVCSTNKEKDGTRWYSEEECKVMWQHYHLPANVKVKTFTEYAQENFDFKHIVMVRGVRDENDLKNEKRVMRLNKEMFGIDKIFYILAEEEFANISASRVRQAAQELDFQTLSQCIPPAIITILLKRVLSAKNLFMVVGRPGSGKSTFLKMLSEINMENIHVNTDQISRAIRPLIKEKFGAETDLINLAIERGPELTAFIAPKWFALLAAELKTVKANSNIFLEIPYGLQSDKSLYCYLGHDILYIGCNKSENEKRLTERGDKLHQRFIMTIPDQTESMIIAEKHGLNLFVVDTGGNLCQLRRRAKNFLKKIKV